MLYFHYFFFFFAAPIAGDRFKSPVPVAMARRQLAFDSQGGSLLSSPIKAGQSILASPSKPVVQSPTSKTLKFVFLNI